MYLILMESIIKKHDAEDLTRYGLKEYAFGDDNPCWEEVLL